MQGMSDQSSSNIESYPSKFNSALQNSSLGHGLVLKILCHVAIFCCLYLLAMLNLLNYNHALSSPVE
jgi:hypothetical protein